MWRFLSGCELPPPKKAKSKNDVLKSSRQYEKSQRQRLFQTSWKQGRPWLVFEDNLMFCTVCKEATAADVTVGHKNSFISGNAQFKVESIKLHEEFQNHKSAKAILLAMKNPRETPVAKFLFTLNSDTIDKLTKLFKTCHALAIHNRPFSDYQWQCKLDEAKGVKIGKTYRNCESAKQFTKAIAEVERKSLASAINTAKFVSVLSDGSTDSAVCEQEMFFLRYVEDGMPIVKFAASVHVERSDSASILSAMQKAISHYMKVPCNVFFSKLVGLGCDGASNMTGQRNGLIALLKKEQPSVVVVHCFAHRLDLAIKDASKSISLHEKVVATLLMGLYYFYHRSTVNRQC